MKERILGISENKKDAIMRSTAKVVLGLSMFSTVVLGKNLVETQNRVVKERTLQGVLYDVGAVDKSSITGKSIDQEINAIEGYRNILAGTTAFAAAASLNLGYIVLRNRKNGPLSQSMRQNEEGLKLMTYIVDTMPTAIGDELRDIARVHGGSVQMLDDMDAAILSCQLHSRDSKLFLTEDGTANDEIT